MGFKRAFKKLRKKLHIPALTLGNAVKAGGVIATGGLPGVVGAVAASKLKSAAIGGIKQAIKSKAQKALARRAMKLTPPQLAATPSAETMPGGAPLPRKRLSGVARRVRREDRLYAQGRKAAAKARAPKRQKAVRATNGAKRRPPPGGKDFKALSVSWRAAGKPGRWIDWVKSH